MRYETPNNMKFQSGSFDRSTTQRISRRHDICHISTVELCTRLPACKHAFWGLHNAFISTLERCLQHRATVLQQLSSISSLAYARVSQKLLRGRGLASHHAMGARIGDRGTAFFLTATLLTAGVTKVRPRW